MKSFELTIDESFFNMLWRSISERESELEFSAQQADTDDAALMGNDIVYIRMCKKELEVKARSANFSEGVFSLEDGYIDLSDL